VAADARARLNAHLSAANLAQEAAYFEPKDNRSFERMYGWAWVLRLALELRTWDDPGARQWAKNLQPLEQKLVALTKDFLPRLTYPVRTGVHQDTAFALGQVLDYARAVGDPALPAQLTTFLSEAKFDVVHFNIGMHGWEYTEEEYRRYLPELLNAIRKGAPGAKLIWASTTPVRQDKSPGPNNARIHARNQIAREYFEKQGIAIDDLNALMTPHPDLHKDDVHFNDEGSAILARKVAESITASWGGL